ncbi:Holliday junction branch migration protein RuvA [Candidatus Azobacteroides pseudotrichonymphae]|uniref:Holliday junction branch migration complex subunit RuvA n=1 Tax=Azobacteroides pseudotrichonymphae genomovar. CFP2 TaxID=511995 RepID=RUVA_AZOPC|nr:Holliday junction branch migration protein RuvA [Candidatus Azobacteroides pseudotrichonymphae]B6YR38.1 RecName: Full=Holliday junction branch migration complex subunit RuvA [Candidatus Azobacteroides pseudotrichonymphae genomovar. CFP2]BAG83660.1 Holliday junction DNA helicase RuvA [Candidatus Azobacteroides pseudotrichonymphae genomovar. CFP2]
MLDFIKGEIVELIPDSVIIETGNIGYMLFISLNTYFSLTKIKSCKLYIYEVIREETHQLFGFIDKKERQLFTHLISVPGVGANIARMVLSSLSVCELEEIIFSGNVSALQALKGIGNKTAERIIIDLKDKVKPDNIPSSDTIITNISSNITKEAITALITLGFSQSASQKVVNKIVSNNSSSTTIEQIIKKALKLL